MKMIVLTGEGDCVDVTVIVLTGEGDCVDR